MKQFKIPTCVENDIEQFQKIFATEIRSSTRLLNTISAYILKTKGKQIRPILVFLSAQLCGKVTPVTHAAAYMVELMHTATLLHDDVVDNAEKRRGFFSLNALWKNKIAVLVGDYFLAKGLLYAIEHKHIHILEIISNAVKDMSEGELLQIEHARSLKNTEEVYFTIIRKKTASLFVAAMQSGAESSQCADSEQIAQCKKIAELLGTAFQIKDDLLDYTKTNIIGKPAHNDIHESKITLPLLHALAKAEMAEQRTIKRILAKKHKSAVAVRTVVEFVKRYKGIEYAQEKLLAITQEAEQILDTMPTNEAQQALKELLQFVGKRSL